MINSRFVSVFAATSIAVTLVGCGGGGDSGGSGSGGTNYTLTGKVIDGYIKGAKVCVDLNVNEVCDASEPVAITSESGAYSLSYTSSLAQGVTPLLVEVPSGATDSGVPVVRGYAMRSMASHASVISPFTTLAYYRLQNNILYQKANPGTMDSVWSAQAGAAMNGFVPDLRSDHVAVGNAALNSAAKYAVATLKYQAAPNGVMNNSFWDSMALDIYDAIKEGYAKPNATADDVANFTAYNYRENVTLSTLDVDLSAYPQTIGLVADSSGALYFATVGTAAQSSKIIRVAPGAAAPVLLADAGGSVNGLAIDSDDVLYFTINNTVMRMSVVNSTVQLVAGSGAAGNQDGVGASASFNQPSGLTVDKNKQVYVIDQSGSRVREIKKVNDAYAVTTPRNSLNNEFILDKASIIYKANSGNLYVAGSAGDLNIFSPQLLLLNTKFPNFDRPQKYMGMVSDVGDRVYLVDMANPVIWQVGSNGASHGQFKSTALANFAGEKLFSGLSNDLRGRFNQPNAIAINKQGQIFVMDSGNKKIRKIN